MPMMPLILRSSISEESPPHEATIIPTNEEPPSIEECLPTCPAEGSQLGQNDTVIEAPTVSPGDDQQSSDIPLHHLPKTERWGFIGLCCRILKH